MKSVGSFITHSLIFLFAWFVLAMGIWGPAQALSTSTLMPWILPLVSYSPAYVTLVLGGAMAILGAFLAALVLLAVLLALEALWHHSKTHLTATRD